MMEGVYTSITSSMSDSTSTSFSTTTAIDRPDILIDRERPEWEDIELEVCHKYTMRTFGSIEEMMETSQNISAVFYVPQETSMKVAKHPFAKGSMRAAYWGLEYDSPDGSCRKVVHKVNLNTKERHQTRDFYEKSAISNQVAATCFAEEFMRVKPSEAPSIEFAEVFLLQYLTRYPESGPAPYCAVELELGGTWDKFNSNAGMVRRSRFDAEEQEHDIIQCFSHWTYQRSGGRMMVVDCQGVFNRATNSYLLTDPAIHCDDVLRFGNTNLNTRGFGMFFKTHKCNRFCRELSLTLVDVSSFEATGGGMVGHGA